MIPSITPAISQTSRIGDLELYDAAVLAEVSGKTVVGIIERQPDLPGVMIFLDKAHTQILGIVSRQKCFERLGRPYGVEVYMNRPIRALYEVLELHPVILPAETTVEEAMRVCLTRAQGERYEPVVVQYRVNHYKLLDFHTLLMAEAHLLNEANHLIRRQIEIGQLISSSLDLDDVLKLILRHLDEAAPYDRAGILLEENGYLNFVAHYDFPPDANIEKFRLHLEESQVYQTIAQTCQPLSLPDVTQSAEWKILDNLDQTRSWAGVPLLYRNKPFGMISLTRLEVRPFTPDELEIALILARQASVAIRNAQLYRQVKHFNQELETMVRERTQQLEAAYTKLETLNRAKSDFIHVTSHELRTPITVISGYMQMIATNELIQAHPQLAALSSGIGNGIARMQEIVNRMLDVAKIDHDQLALHFAPVNLSWLLQCIYEEFYPIVTDRHLKLQVESVPENLYVTGDEDALRKVFQNLLYNAIKYTPDGGQIRLWSSNHTIENGHIQPAIQMVVEDTGLGIAPEHHEVIFEKFFVTGKVSLHSSGKTKFKGGGIGLGLAIAKGIVEAHGGKIWAESAGYDEETLPGSRFHVLLPLSA